MAVMIRYVDPTILMVGLRHRAIDYCPKLIPLSVWEGVNQAAQL